MSADWTKVRLNRLHSELAELQKEMMPGGRFVWNAREREALITVMDAVKDSA